jgi:hypothetical protein
MILIKPPVPVAIQAPNNALGLTDYAMKTTILGAALLALILTTSADAQTPAPAPTTDPASTTQAAAATTKTGNMGHKAMKSRYERLSPEQKASLQNRMKARWDSITPEEKQALKENARDRRRTKMEAMTPEQREKFMARRQERKAKKAGK